MPDDSAAVEDFDGGEWRDCLVSLSHQVSTIGRVRSKGRVVLYKDGRQRVFRQYLFKIAPHSILGYCIVSFSKGNVKKDWYVHRLVWEAFNGKIPDNLEINHKNGNKSDNRLENLEIVTHQENMMHSISTGLRKTFVVWGAVVKNPNAR